MAVVFQSGITNGVRIYINGAIDAQATAAGPGNVISTPLRLGNVSDNPLNISTPTFNGVMDEVRIWNRALCQAEIIANKNGELPNPTTQAGLVAYYTFDQGTAGGNNTSLTTITDLSGHGNTGTLTNFTLTGTTSNYMAGAPAITGTLPAYFAAPSSISESVTRTISGTTAFTGCGSIATIAPGTLTGSVTAKVTNDASVQTYNGQPYVQRHFDIEPASGAATATASITLYYKQADFTAYNAAPNHGLNLPASTSDNANAANLRITQYHGVPTGGNAPANYPATVSGFSNPHISITPSSVTYNSVAGRWEVVIPVTGFSGFFATSVPNNPLPVKLLSFTANKASGSSNLIAWATGIEDAGTLFEVTRSRSGTAFDELGSVAGAGNNNTYSFPDERPLSGVNYYRLKITEAGGGVSYSNTAIVRNAGGGGIAIAPQPGIHAFTITNTDAALTGQEAVIYNMEGAVMARFALSSVHLIDISSWAAGIYILRLPSGDAVRMVKQ